MIESLFSKQNVRSKQLTAPLLREREEYLVRLLSQEVSTTRVRDIASMLLHVVRLLKLDSPRIVHIEEIRDAAARWVHDVDPHLSRKVGPTSEHNFAFIATRWLRYVNLIHAPILPERPIDVIVEGFVESMKQRRMYLQNLIWHQWNKVAPLFRLGLGIKDPGFGQFEDALKKRHDIVHRSGFTKTGERVIVNVAEIEALCEQITRFATDINEELANPQEGNTT